MADDKKVLTLKDEGPPEPPPPDAPKSLFERMKFLIYLAGAGSVFLAVFVCGYGATYLLMPTPEPIIPGGKIAVLPFTTGSENSDHLAESFQSLLIERLGEVDEFEVVPEATVDKLKGDSRKLDAIGKELGVRYLVEGKVTAEGENVTLNVTMADIEKGGLVFQEAFRRSTVVPWSAIDGAATDILEGGHITLEEGEKVEVKRAFTNEEYWERKSFGDYYCALAMPTDEAAAETAMAQKQAAIAAYDQAAAFAGDKKDQAGAAHVAQTECILSLVAGGTLAEADAMPLAKAALEKAIAADESLKTNSAVTALATKVGLTLE